MTALAAKDAKVGGFYWANIGRKNLIFYAKQEQRPIKERVQIVEILGDMIKVKSANPDKTVIVVEVKEVFR